MAIGRVRTNYAGLSTAAQSATARTLSQMDKEKQKPKRDASGAVIGGALAGSAMGEGMGQLDFNTRGQTAPVGGSIKDGIKKGIGTGGMDSRGKAPTTTPTAAAGPKPTGISGAGWGAVAGAGMGLLAHYLDE
ncbi:hypothetical protein KAR91_65590 [Candidatus Pacearchaeota archaeon]|nr:hypothetical protein [Candidatus Pacearchaeota archaeon]